ncbi:MAG: hypothetical protein EOM52_09515 [Clostridia bacterium]|nr:hypothetical protein [Clostridia bacterium]
MRNLKKMLSLVMALAMVASFMVVGASAADFPDQKDIVNKDAVGTLVALGVIKGNEKGEFNPKGIVTRAEMAKMICVALNGGNDPKLIGGTGMFTDTKGHWAEGYIEYCANLGIVAGRGGNKFDPNATVTGAEAAKMILIAIGYSAENEKFTGAQWALNVSVRASQKDLYNKLAINAAEGLTRDNAAQMIWNGMNATMIKYEYQLNTVNGNLTSVAIAVDKTGSSLTILDSKFKVVTETGILSVVNYNKDTKEYTYTVSGAVNNAGTALGNTHAAVSGLKTTADFTALYGQKVKVLFTRDSSNTVDKVYGIYGVSNNVLTTTVGEITAPTTVGADKYFKVGDTKYTLGDVYSNVPAYTYSFNAAASGSLKLNTIAADKSSTVVFVSTDDNSDFDYAVVLPVTVGKVTYVGADNITAKNGTYSFKDDVIAEGIKKDEFVKLTASTASFDGKSHVVKINTLSGKIDGARSGEVSVDGVWYKTTALDSSSDTLTLGESYDLYIVGKYIYSASQTSSNTTVKDILYVSASEVAGAISSSKTKVYFTDGTSKIVDVSKVGGTKIAQGTGVANGLYTFKEKDGAYELTAISGSNKAGFASYLGNAGNFTKKDTGVTAKMTNCYIADDAIVFVNDAHATKGGIKVITGADLKGWNSDYTATSMALTKTVNGLETATVLLLTGSAGIPDAAGVVGNYGFITTAPYTVKDGDDTYATYTIWNGTSSVVVKDETTNAVNTLNKGDVIKYTVVKEGYIKDSTTSGMTAAAIVGYDKTNIKLVKADGTTDSNVIMVDKDTVFMYVNTKDSTGIANGEIGLANKNADGSYTMNAYYYYNSSNKAADLIVYDVNNDLETAGAAKATVTVTDNATTGVATANVANTVAVVGEKATFTATLPAGKTFATAVRFTFAGTGLTSTSVVLPAGTYAAGHQVVAQVPVSGDVSSMTLTTTDVYALTKNVTIAGSATGIGNDKVTATVVGQTTEGYVASSDKVTVTITSGAVTTAEVQGTVAAAGATATSGLATKGQVFASGAASGTVKTDNTITLSSVSGTVTLTLTLANA